MIVFLAFGLPFAANGMLCIKFEKSELIFKFTRESIELSLNWYPDAFEEFSHDVTLRFPDGVERFTRDEDD
jgi:hypothetical protein